MPITTGMLLGMIKQLDKRIKKLEKDQEQVRITYTRTTEEAGENTLWAASVGEVRDGKDTVSDLGPLHP